MTDFDAIREANIKANRALLIELGLEQPLTKPKPKPKNASVKGKKRKASPAYEAGTPRPAKVVRVASDEDGDSNYIPPRRSARHANKDKISYDEFDSQASTKLTAKSRGLPSVSLAATIASKREHEGNRLGKRLHNPKKFGAIPGVEVGTWWETRAACSTDAIHAPFVAGIAGSAIDGAYSVALSGGYDDDVDLGYAFTYTGSGGRDLKGTKTNPKNLRTAPQSCDQTFDNPMNAALKRSSETKKPVRVIRGFKLDSPYAPETGYRYDGLYTVEKAWLERGLNKHGYKVCKYAFKRINGQSPLPITQGEEAEEGEEAESDGASERSEHTTEDVDES